MHLSTVQEFAHQILCNLLLPLVAIGKKLFLIVQEFFVCLGCKLIVGTFHNGIYRTGFLAEATINALRHVDIVPGGTACSVLTGFRLDGDGLSWTNGLTKLAGDTTFISSWVSPQGMLSTEAWAQIPLLKGVVDGYLGLGTDFQRQRKTTSNLRNKKNL